MKKNLLLIIALLCAGVQGIWAQTRVTNESELAQAVKTDGANIVMTADFELSQPVVIQTDNGNGVSVTINMNDKKLSYKTAVGQSTASCVFVVPAGSTLNLSKGTIADVTNLSGNNTKYVAGAIVNDGTATLDNVTFSGCKGLLGGAIKNNEGATLNLNACTFDGNEASTKKDFDSGSGGAIWNNGTLVLSTITIQNCIADLGAGIFNAEGGTVSMSTDNNETIFSQNTANVNGGAIFSNGSMSLQHVNFKNNTAPNGGAIYVSAKGVVEIGTGSFFTDNKASTQGGAIYNGGTLKMKGSITANQNTGADDQFSNVFLVKGKVITVAGSLVGSKIGISVPEMPSVFTSGYSTDHKDIAPNTIFSSDYESDLYSAYLTDNEASVGVPSPFYITEEDILRKAIDKLDNVNFKLSNDINITNSTLVIPSNKTMTIDLGGFTLDRGLKGREWDTGGQVITVRKDATLNLSNGTLTGGWGGDSGGINNEGGTVNLTDVTITGCTGDDRGGGICNRDGGTLTMKGGSLTNNTSNDATHPRGGGGLFNAEGATATLTGVTITGNVAKVYGGGGICNYGALTIDGCTITGNTCKTDGGAIWNYSKATLTMKGKNTVTDNTGGEKSDNVYLPDGLVINVTGSLADSKIGINLEKGIGTFTSGYKKNNSDVDPATVFNADNAVVFVPALSGDETALTLQQLVKAASDADLRTAASFDGANIQLAGDIKMSNSTLVIGEGKTVTIDLNGKTLDRGLTSRDFDHGGQVITVRKGGTLNLSNGKLTGGYGGNGGGLANEEGTATLTDVTITGCTGDQRGGGISNYGTLTMTGGSITGNTSNDIKASDTDLVGGGGIYTSGGSTTTLTGVTITGNQAKGAGGGGVNNWGTVTIDGCTITGNTSKANGGGVWNGPGSTINMQGKNTVTDNQDDSKTNNVFLRDGVVITVTGALTDSKIGIRMATPGTFTSGYNANNKDVAPIKFFVSDDDDYTVVLKDDEVELKANMGTAITDVESRNNVEGIWYDLNGRKLQGKPTQKGVYIIGGKTVVIK